MRKATHPTRLMCNGRTLTFDAIIKRETSLEADVPEYPIEEGFYTTDAVLKKPLSLSLKGFISNKPVSWGTGGDTNRLKNAIATLEEIFFSGELVTLISNGRTYQSMVIESLSIPETDEMINAVEVELSLKQVRIASSKTTTIPDDYGMSGATAEDAGTAPTTEEKDKGIIESACSWLYDMFKGK